MQNINFKKSLGQNFIFDKNLLNAIATDGEVGKEDVVLEVGAGAGTLTEILCKKAKNVISYEIDRSLETRLNAIKESNPNLTLCFEDFLQADLSRLGVKPTKVVANIPYYITTQIIFKLIESDFKSILVLVQKEVAERFSAQIKTKQYGITSVILQSIFDVKITRIVKKENFTPQPKVDSATVKFTPHNKYKIENFKQFTKLIHLAFSMRRKTLVNNLKKYYDKNIVEEILSKLTYNANVRPEEISVENYIKIFEELNKKQK